MRQLQSAGILLPDVLILYAITCARLIEVKPIFSVQSHTDSGDSRQSNGAGMHGRKPNTMLTWISTEFLTRPMQGQPILKVDVGVRHGVFSYAFE